MNLIILLVVGGIIGWVASLIMNTDGQQGIILNVVVGIVGALLAGFVVTPLIGGASIMNGGINVQTILISLVGSVILLAVLNLMRRGTVR
ncbi:GlsB/YeaQ/YmgE family stress response membrane protein [Sphingomonas panacisoli]|uniref:GlsB/YeaQ/YmgE family stress response membrane protein n=1 Tax=Sphingomonas panacisoli TaxID=1813879 RepID=A0A5B8LF69_9SPHN|nr:GlsB/YeaQ/YmgE family stress response membrane protein [Sphingomonas panacisoli]QDZ06837.1 GlsB/YeaQ/YmgE family stress response membrane protein [Sphingomonas panacisoli]